VAGVTPVPYAGRVFDEDEVEAAVASTLDFWLTLGPQGDAFEKELAVFLGVRRCILANSGSSANLLAVCALSSPKVGERRMNYGDEIITVAAGFPTTVAPIVQNGFVPVFIDSDPGTLNARSELLEQAYDPEKTRAVLMAHTLGNPFDVAAVLEFCERHGLWLIEDNCDALGCTYTLPAEHPLIAKLGASTTEPLTKWTGAWGDLSTQSFYPPHHLTLGEGGSVSVVKDMRLKVAVESFRDWGRDCWCASGVDNTCGKRFGWQLGGLPSGYDHKFTYGHLGYNLKPLDIQAAIGRQQLKKLPAFIKARKKNWEYLRSGLADLSEFFDFALPTHARSWTKEGFIWDESGLRTDPSWFGFLIRVKASAPFKKSSLAKHLDEKKVGNRMLFGGNLVRQPAFVQLAKDRPGSFRVIGELKGADEIMVQAMFLGTYPGLTKRMLDYEIDVIRSFVKKH
jgi:CDP-6-deoxy-D-xylo-4-hexulose-3-dehydrase